MSKTSCEKVTLKELREMTGLSQEEYAKKINMKYGTYIKKELGLRGLKAQEIIDISDFTGVDIRSIELKSV